MWTLANPRLQAAFFCLLIALVYTFFWPGRRNPERARQRPLGLRIILRWFHPLTWILIGVAVLYWSRVAAAAAIVAYLVFTVTMSRDRRSASG